MNNSKGHLICFEGICNQSKREQCLLLQKFLHSKSIITHIIEFPEEDNKTGELLNEYYFEKSPTSYYSPLSLHCLLSANRYESEEKIKRYLQDGIWVLCHSYKVDAAVRGRLLSKEIENWVIKMNSLLIEPCVTYILDSDVTPMFSPLFNMKQGFIEFAHNIQKYGNRINNMFLEEAQSEEIHNSIIQHLIVLYELSPERDA